MLSMGRNLACAVCKALGLNPAVVRSLTLHLSHTDAVRVTVEHYVTEEQDVTTLDVASGVKARVHERLRELQITELTFDDDEA